MYTSKIKSRKNWYNLKHTKIQVVAKINGSTLVLLQFFSGSAYKCRQNAPPLFQKLQIFFCYFLSSSCLNIQYTFCDNIFRLYKWCVVLEKLLPPCDVEIIKMTFTTQNKLKRVKMK